MLGASAANPKKTNRLFGSSCSIRATVGLKLYVWRVWPRIDKGETDHHICTLREPIDEEFVLQTFGSGRYLVMLKDTRRKLIRKHTFSVHNSAFAPKVDESEVLRVPENDVYFKVWAKKPDGGTSKSEREEAKKDVAEILRAHS